MSTYKQQTIDTRVRLGVLSNAPTWHPRTHDENRKLRPRNPDDRDHIRMRIELAIFDYTTVDLVWSELSMPPIE